MFLHQSAIIITTIIICYKEIKFQNYLPFVADPQSFVSLSLNKMNFSLFLGH